MGGSQVSLQGTPLVYNFLPPGTVYPNGTPFFAFPGSTAVPLMFTLPPGSYTLIVTAGPYPRIGTGGTGAASQGLQVTVGACLNLCNTGLGEFQNTTVGVRPSFLLPVPPSTTNGTVDLHWQLAEPFPSFPSGTPLPAIEVSTLIFGPVYANEPVSVWLANGPASEWITPSAAPLNPELGGGYVYRTTFNGTHALTGQLSSDNEVIGVYLNGTLVSGPLTGPASFGTFTLFDLGTSSPSLNTLDVVVRNRGVGGIDISPTPAGLRMEFDQNQCVVFSRR
jgi:hypothetical protein